MKKALIVAVNICIMIAIMVFVVLYSSLESRDAFQRQVEHFENTTVTMERVTENYLEGEQRICDVWAKMLTDGTVTMDEAVALIRESSVLPYTSAHIVYVDTLKGLSTHPRQGTTDDYAVSYGKVNILDDTDWISGIGESINLSRAYTNPIDGEQSLAFCNKISLRDPNSVTPRDAVLLRVIPVSQLEQKWIFPQAEFENADLAMIDSDGDYILKGSTFKNSNFFEFYRSYNPADLSSVQELFNRVVSSTGTNTMLNSHGTECMLAFTPMAETAGWTLLSLVPTEDLYVNQNNWLLTWAISIGLILLFIFDLLYLMHFNKRLKLAANEAESASKAKTDFLSTMSHDIRTPMNAIIGLTTIAEKNLGDTEATAENLRKIGLASNHLLTLINDILDISKVESGKLNLSPATFSIVERKSVFALFAAAASFAAAWSFLLKSIITVMSNRNRIRRPAETKPISSQFSAFTFRSFIGIRLRNVHPPAASTGV